MTRTHHHITDSYLTAYQDQLRHDIAAARRSGPTLAGVRRIVGTALVRIGAWLFPETPEIVDGRIIVLARPVDSGQLGKAA